MVVVISGNKSTIIVQITTALNRELKTIVMQDSPGLYYKLLIFAQ
jgi:transcriptional regulator of acetoin/glycerol metabolism